MSRRAHSLCADHTPRTGAIVHDDLLTETLATLPVRPGATMTLVIAAALLGLVVLAAAVAGRRTSQGEVALEEREKGRR